MAGLLAMAALGGTGQSANGVASRIRLEAEQAFAERMSDKQFNQSVQLEGIRHTNQSFMEDKRIAADDKRAKDNRDHEAGLLKTRLDAESAEAKKDRAHSVELEVAKAERALAKASATNSAKGDETTRKAYELLIEKKYELHDTLTQNGETEKAKAIWSDIVRLEDGMRSAFGVNMPEPPKPTLESITAKVLQDNGLEDTPENRKAVHDDMRSNPQFAQFFTGTGEEPTTAETGGGLLGVSAPKPEQPTSPNPATNPLLNPLAAQIAEKDSQSATKAKEQERQDLSRQREEFAGDLDKSEMDLRKASQEMAQAYSKIKNGAGGSLSAAQLAKLRDIIEAIRTSGMTDAESTQAKAILDYIESRS